MTDTSSAAAPDRVAFTVRYQSRAPLELVIPRRQGRLPPGEKFLDLILQRLGLRDYASLTPSDAEHAAADEEPANDVTYELFNLTQGTSVQPRGEVLLRSGDVLEVRRESVAGEG